MGNWGEYFDLTKFEVLRVLILKWDGLTKIPHSISELKHLTYLSITANGLKMLPLSIGLLYNLLALQVDCDSLEYLPENIGDLANLQFLFINSGRNLKEIPKSLCSLTDLLELTIYHIFLPCSLNGKISLDRRFLDYVPHGLVNFPLITKVKACWKVRTIGWLKDMKDLKGMLCIENLKNINNLEDAKCAKLRNKCKLESLELHWDYREYIILYGMDSQLELKLVPEACEGGIVRADDVHFSLLECLQPHPNLKTLLVSGYPSTIVPGWMRDPLLLHSIEELWLHRCGIQSLPFGNLHTFKYLYIGECSSIRTMQLEQLPSQLEKLVISSCDHLELITGFGHLDMLKELSIDWCETLKSLTMDGLQLVESTELFGDLSHEIPQINRQSISSLTTLEIISCRSLHLLPDWLISSGPCDVYVRGCGCPDYGKSIQSDEGSDQSLSDEDIEDELDQLTYDNDCT